MSLYLKISGVSLLPFVGTRNCTLLLISYFRRVLNAVFFLLGDSRSLNFICRYFGTPCLFHLPRRWGDEIVGVFIREKVWLENRLSQSTGRWGGRGVSDWRNRLWRAKIPSGGLQYICEVETAHCWSEEGEPWDGRDQTVVFQVAVSFL
jgi:hypothetical protein